MPKAITIIGGGIAGLSLGIALRQRGVPVTLWEAGRYPRHRVCGEFICGRGQKTLQRFGLISLLQEAGACWARNAAFFAANFLAPRRPLPQAALCISRFALDKSLAGEFERLGGELKAEQRWQGSNSDGIIYASGRRVEVVVDGWRWIGLKAHAKNVPLVADMELHFIPNGYVGLCRLAGGIVNVCGLFRSKTPISNLSKTWRQWLLGPPDSALNSRLLNAEFDEATFCAVAGLDMRPRRALNLDLCCIGDALTMIPPMTGNGMSMALESAEIAVDPVVEFSRGDLDWHAVHREIASACDARFQRRLRWAALLQKALFSIYSRSVLMLLATRSGWVRDSLFHLTR